MQLADISAVVPVMEQGLLRRFLWPRINNQRDAQLAGQQGQWLCTVVGSVWMIGGWFTPRPWLCLVIGAMFVLAGVGVRQHRVSAAVLAFLCLFLDRLAALVALLLQVPGGGNPRIGIVAMLLLLLNIRATWLAHRWYRQQPGMESRMQSSWQARLWPRLRYVFYPLASLFVLMSVVALASLPGMHRRIVGREADGVHQR